VFSAQSGNRTLMLAVPITRPLFKAQASYRFRNKCQGKDWATSGDGSGTWPIPCIRPNNLMGAQKPEALPLSVSHQFSREQVRFDGKIVGALHVSAIRRGLGLLHVALDLLHRVLLVRSELTAGDFLQIRIAGS
jgi:hypothetical protein